MNDYREFTPISMKQVYINDAFWSPRIESIIRHSIPHIYEWCEQTGRIDALRLQWQQGDPEPHIFWDSDVFKWLEAASYALMHHPDELLKAKMDDIIEIIAGAQQPDGYLNVYFTAVHPERRWTDLEGAHELYCAGHLFEAAVAHHDVTGMMTLLEVAKRYADYLCAVFGDGEGQLRGYPGHEEVELALIKLYRVTEEQRYLELVKYFIDARGKEPNWFDVEREQRSYPGILDGIRPHMGDPKEYNQSHKPVREQTEVVGHAVRGMYLYSGMTDLYAEMGDATLLRACESLWNHLTGKRMYVTGGVGSTQDNEGYTVDYDLPNETAYCETCAAVGLVMWNHRMLQVHGEGKYAELLERALYNAVLAGVSLDGEMFNYSNPLASDGTHHRQSWYDVSCCPSNVARLLTSLGQYIYSANDEEIVVHLFVGSTAEISLGGNTIQIHQSSELPWEPMSSISVNVPSPIRFALRIRVPSWAAQVEWIVNGVRYEVGELVQGYARFDRVWSNDDTVEVRMSMPIQRLYANPHVQACRGRVALSRGPLIYCLEQVDNGELETIDLPVDAVFVPEYRPDVLAGITILVGEGIRVRVDEASTLYSARPYDVTRQQIMAIPYSLWDNRESGEMLVWIPQSIES